jgi:hypothetical protein
MNYSIYDSCYRKYATNDSEYMDHELYQVLLFLCEEYCNR